jgi:hypothetical protein
LQEQRGLVSSRPALPNRAALANRDALREAGAKVPAREAGSVGEERFFQLEPEGVGGGAELRAEAGGEVSEAREVVLIFCGLLDLTLRAREAAALLAAPGGTATALAPMRLPHAQYSRHAFQRFRAHPTKT